MKQARRISRQLVERAQSPTRWDVGNGVLYDLCRRFPGHGDASGVVAKVWLIGRAYSASIERGRGESEFGGLNNETFYTEKVPDVLRRSNLDRKLRPLRKLKRFDPGSVAAGLDVHHYLVDRLEDLTAKRKRSFASKYLHFHLPDLFFIYDSRAAASMDSLDRTNADAGIDCDPQYSSFVVRAMRLRERVKKQHGIELSPREIDRLLLILAAGER